MAKRNKLNQSKKVKKEKQTTIDEFEDEEEIETPEETINLDEGLEVSEETPEETSDDDDTWTEKEIND